MQPKVVSFGRADPFEGYSTGETRCGKRWVSNGVLKFDCRGGFGRQVLALCLECFWTGDAYE